MPEFQPNFLEYQNFEMLLEGLAFWNSTFFVFENSGCLEYWEFHQKNIEFLTGILKSTDNIPVKNACKETGPKC